MERVIQHFIQRVIQHLVQRVMERLFYRLFNLQHLQFYPVANIDLGVNDQIEQDEATLLGQDGGYRHAQRRLSRSLDCERKIIQHDSYFCPGDK